jgi:hypothetical protein
MADENPKPQTPAPALDPMYKAIAALSAEPMRPPANPPPPALATYLLAAVMPTAQTPAQSPTTTTTQGEPNIAPEPIKK